MTITELAKANPDAKVRLLFRDAKGQSGTMLTTAKHAVCPNRSQRFFPPADQTPVSMGWPVPYWYACECYGFEIAA